MEEELTTKLTGLALKLLVFLGISIPASIGLFNAFLNTDIFRRDPNEVAKSFSTFNSFSGPLAILILTVISIFLFAFVGTFIFDLKRSLADEKEKKRAREDYLATGELIPFLRYNLLQIREYYVINKNQARNTYWASIVVSLAGLGGLGISILGWRNDVENFSVLVPVAGIAGSIILEFIGYSILNIYRTTLQQLNSYFTQLVRLQELLLTLELNKEFPDELKNESGKRILDTLLKSYEQPFQLGNPDLVLYRRGEEDAEPEPVPEGEKPVPEGETPPTAT